MGATIKKLFYDFKIALLPERSELFDQGYYNHYYKDIEWGN